MHTMYHSCGLTSLFEITSEIQWQSMYKNKAHFMRSSFENCTRQMYNREKIVQ